MRSNDSSMVCCENLFSHERRRVIPFRKQSTHPREGRLPKRGPTPEAHSEIALVLLAMVDQILSRVLRSQGTASRLISAVRPLKHGQQSAAFGPLPSPKRALVSADRVLDLLAASSVRPRAPAPQRARGRGKRTSPRCRGGAARSRAAQSSVCLSRRLDRSKKILAVQG
jgi:hypothetical protein